MDRKYLEEHLSAYLDNELEPKQLREFEQELKKYPDLTAEVAQLQRLNQLAREAEIAMPADGYFDGLAGRIDARIEREFPRERSRIVDFFLARRKTVALISSAAAVLLIAVIGIEFYGPGKEMYPRQIQKTIDVKPTPETSHDQTPISDTDTNVNSQRQSVAPPRAYGDTVLASVKKAMPDEREVKEKTAEVISDSLIIAPAVPDQEAARTIQLVPNPPAATKDAAVAVETTKVAEVVPTALPESPQSQSPKQKETKSLQKATRLDQPTSESISGGAELLSLSGLSDDAASGSHLAWPTENPTKLEDMLEKLILEHEWRKIENIPGIPIPVSGQQQSATTIDRWTSLDIAKSSLSIDRWHAERAFLIALEDNFSRQSCVFARVVIKHYLNLGELVDRDLWEARLDSVRVAEDKLRENE